MADPNRRSTRIWVRCCLSPSDTLAPLGSTKLMGGNQGNLLYQFATCRALSADSAELTTLSYSEFENGPVEARAERINAEADHLVLPLSNSFRLSMLETLDQWSDLLERLTVPVTVVGVGAQVRLDDARRQSFVPGRVSGAVASDQEIRRHERAVRRFVCAVLERSTSIGVRGALTKKYLVGLGFPADRIDVIGCPSLFMAGPDFRAPRARRHRLSRLSPVSLSFDHRIESTADLLDRSVRHFPRATVYAQEKLIAQMVLLGTDTRTRWTGDPRFPVQVSHPLYAAHRLVYAPTAWSWIAHLGKQHFAVGPRLHGTVAAILAGTPAHLLVHDSRTLEIAEHHALPYTLTRDLNRIRSIADLYAGQSFERFDELYPERFAAFISFLKRNDLPVAYEGSSQALARFDRSVVEPARAPLQVSRGPRNPALRARRVARAVRSKTQASRVTASVQPAEGLGQHL